ncbi:MAG: V-type ATP synthase subunit D [Candidatus Heimdallarchaeaceae archaeon]
MSANIEFGTVKTTRMELLNIRAKIKLAQKGHDLLKEKMDALVLELYAIKDEVRAAKKQIEEELLQAYKALAKAEMMIGPDKIRDFAQYAPEILQLQTLTTSIMGVKAPRFIVTEVKEAEEEKVFYGLANSSAQLDLSEINKTKRRVNALNYILIPKLKAIAVFIASSLEEQERETFSRLKRVKDILEAKKH